MKEKLVWKEEGRKTVYSCRIFSAGERLCRSPDNRLKTFNVLDAPDWAIIIPELKTERGIEFVMVRQWRHGAGEISLEFPAGVFEDGEDPATAAARELREETGYIAHTIEKLGVFNPNPAIMSNRVHFFLARDLELAGQDLDEDEYIEVETVPMKDALDGMGKPPFIHALMGTALTLYLKEKRE